MNGYNFTERVRKSLALARENASRRQHEYVGAEHILLGILEEGEGVATAVLQNLGIDLDELKLTVAGRTMPASSGPTGPDLPYTSRAKKVLELAMAEARDLNHSYLGTEHVLLALLREENGIPAQTLTALGLTAESTRREVLRMLGGEQPAATGDVPSPPSRPRTNAREDLHAPSSPSGVASITIDVRFVDGTNVHGNFREVERAYRFLVQLMRDQ